MIHLGHQRHPVKGSHVSNVQLGRSPSMMGEMGFQMHWDMHLKHKILVHRYYMLLVVILLDDQKLSVCRPMERPGCASCDCHLSVM